MAWFSAFVTLLGMLVTSYVIGTVTSFIGQNDRAEALYQERIERIKDLLAQRGSHGSHNRGSIEVRRRILRYFEYSWKNGSIVDEDKLMSELPFTLRLQLTLILHKKLFWKENYGWRHFH